MRTQTSIVHHPQFQIIPMKLEHIDDFMTYANRIGGESRFLAYGENEFPIPKHRVEQYIFTGEISNRDIMISAFFKSKMIGSASITTPKSAVKAHNGELGISVLKRFWNQGVGSALMNYLIDWIEDNKVITKVTFEVFIDNERAIHLYDKFGFKKEGRISRSFFIDEEYRDTLVMGREFDFNI